MDFVCKQFLCIRPENKIWGHENCEEKNENVILIKYSFCFSLNLWNMCGFGGKFGIMAVFYIHIGLLTLGETKLV